MTVFVDHSEANYTEEVNRRGAVQRQFDYFGKTSPHHGGPEAFLVDYGPERTTTAHFHSVDQFQVFFGASGARYQRHPIPEVELHYADAFFTYGPFSAGEERMRFFTLRPREGQFRGDMPSDRDKLEYRGKRGLHVDVHDRLSTEPPDGRCVEVALLEPADDGLAATLISAGPNSEIPLAPTVATSGRYLCVLAGGVIEGGRLVGPMSLAWTPPNEPAQVLRSSDAPVTRVLAMTFPFPPTPEAADRGR